MASGALIAWGLSEVFSGRGAYIHFGAIIGTIMVGNVFAVIMPGQRKLVDALKRAEEPDPGWGAKAKLRSTHNTYLTLPLLFIMISNHYPMTYGHALNWLVLLAIVVITALARQYFVLRHTRTHRPALIGAAIAGTVLLAAWLAPAPRHGDTPAAAQLSAADLAQRAQAIIVNRCASCHAQSPSDDVFTVAPGGVLLENARQIAQWAPRIKARSVDSHDMPFMNKTGMLDEERVLVAQWIAAGAPLPAGAP
jgi:uncharacterized membrane protein